MIEKYLLDQLMNFLISLGNDSIGLRSLVICCNLIVMIGIFFSLGGMYMKEVDRVLRPGGYWILAGPPINWKNNYRAWQRPEDELEEEQRQIEDVAKLLCWEKKHEKGEIAIWRKALNKDDCSEPDSQQRICEAANTNHYDVW